MVKLFIDEIVEWVLKRIKKLKCRAKVIDYSIGRSYSYVLVGDDRGRSLGLALTPIEDIIGCKLTPSRRPSIGNLPEMVSSINPLEKVLGVALLNALSSHLLWRVNDTDRLRVEFGDLLELTCKLVEEPIMVVGNMAPLVRSLKEHGFKRIYVTERNPSFRCGISLPDNVFLRLIGSCRSLVVTGATLVNDTIDLFLEFRGNSKLLLVGPTASIHPKPAFKLGVSAIASLAVKDIDSTIEVIKLGGSRWDFTKYCRQYLILPKTHEL